LDHRHCPTDLLTRMPHQPGPEVPATGAGTIRRGHVGRRHLVRRVNHGTPRVYLLATTGWPAADIPGHINCLSRAGQHLAPHTEARRVNSTTSGPRPSSSSSNSSAVSAGA